MYTIILLLMSIITIAFLPNLWVLYILLHSVDQISLSPIKSFFALTKLSFKGTLDLFQ